MVIKPTGQNVSELIVEYQPRIKSFIRQRVTNKEDAEDILQDVFYQLTKTINVAMNPIENVSAWLYRVANNMIINAGKKKKEESLPEFQDDESDGEVITEFSEILFGDDPNATPETEYLRSLVWEELEKALSELPPEQRTVYELTELEGISLKEISASTGVSVNTLLSRKHYAILHLRKKMKFLYDEVVFS